MSVYDDIAKASLEIGKSAPLGLTEAAALSAFYWIGTYPGVVGAEGWEEIDIADNPSGYDAVALLHKPSKTLVIINRGAEGSFFGDDWRAGFSAAVGDPVPKLKECVAFAADSWAKCAGRADAIFITGQSWGGALTEAQVMLVRQRIGKADIPVNGIAFASAGFKKTIRQLASILSLDWVDAYADDVEHYIRTWDPIRVTSFNGWCGKVHTVGSVYTERMQDLPHGQRGPRRRVALALADVNHDRTFYYRYPNLSPAKHVLITLNGGERVVNKPNP